MVGVQPEKSPVSKLPFTIGFATAVPRATTEPVESRSSSPSRPLPRPVTASVAMSPARRGKA